MKKISPEQLTQACAILCEDGLIGLPTETVYGLAANALSDSAVARIYALKKRPQFNPLIAHVASIKQAEEHVIFNEWAHKLAAVFWPGPLTLILPKAKASPLSLLASAGLETLAIRMPAHPIAQQLLRTLDFPVVAPSANPSESISPTRAEHVRHAFPDLYVLDGGACTLGLESTIVDLTQDAPAILRPGSIIAPEIEKVLGCSLKANKDKILKSPGQLKRHYAPSIPLRLQATTVNPGEALLSFGSHKIKGAAREINLSSQGDLTEAAAHLFTALSKLDSSDYTGIAAMAIPHEGIGLAINDRLTRASS